MLKNKVLAKLAEPLRKNLKNPQIFREFVSNFVKSHENLPRKRLFLGKNSLENAINDKKSQDSSLSPLNFESIPSILRTFADKTRKFTRNDKVQAFRAIARFSKAFPVEDKEILRDFGDFITEILAPELENLNELGIYSIFVKISKSFFRNNRFSLFLQEIAIIFVADVHKSVEIPAN